MKLLKNGIEHSMTDWLLTCTRSKGFVSDLYYIVGIALLLIGIYATVGFAEMFV